GQARDGSTPDIGADEYSVAALVREMPVEEIGGAGVQWPNSTLDEEDPAPALSIQGVTIN
ncbi:unnamed protein product, partial [marine sediment metagenome]